MRFMIEKIMYKNYMRRFQYQGFVESIRNGKLNTMRLKKLLSYYYTMKETDIQTDFIEEFLYVIDDMLPKINLSTKQRHRLYLWNLGFREIEIAQLEHVSQKVIHNTLVTITNKIYHYINTNY